MPVNLMRGLCLWAAALYFSLLLWSLPLSPQGQWLGGVLGGLLALLGWRLAARRSARQQQAAGLSGLPPADYRQPLLLVCGDGLAALFGSEEQAAVRTVEQGCYVPVAAPERLPGIVDTLLARRAHWSGQLAVLYVVNPAEHVDRAVLAGRLRSFRHQLALARRRGVRLPLLLVSYLASDLDAGNWFCWETGQGGPLVRGGGAPLELQRWQRQGAERSRRAQVCVQLNGHATWLTQSVLPHLQASDPRDAACASLACAVATVPAVPAARPDNLWQQWLHERCGLEALDTPAASATGSLPFPDALLSLLPQRRGNTPRRRAAGYALGLFAGAAGLALASSAWQNLLLLRQVSDDLRRFQAAPRAQPAALEQALAVLRADAERLDRYYRHGAPLRLGLGLYRGERLRPPLQAAIAGYRLPQQTPANVPMPAAVRLDSLSLFASGSAELKPGSTKVLVNALVDIKAQPGWLIVISGHTDATGDVQRNLQLSRARAAAVRDWMQRMGDIPDSCFAVQGFGASQPLGSNDTPDGRAANRRVDIRLLPERGACEPAAPVTDGSQRPRAQAAVSIPQ